MNRKRWIWLGAFIVLITAVILIDAKKLKRPDKLKGGFQEVAFFRNKNNTGTVLRVYAVSVKNPKEAEYRNYGNAMPHTSHGNTIVYFFNAEEAAPHALTIDYPHFDTTSFNAIGVYKKDGNGTIKLEGTD